VVCFRWERSFDRSYCRKNVGTDGNPFQNSKTYHYGTIGKLENVYLIDYIEIGVGDRHFL